MLLQDMGSTGVLPLVEACPPNTQQHFTMLVLAAGRSSFFSSILH
jgi:hypothetical protein